MTQPGQEPQEDQERCNTPSTASSSRTAQRGHKRQRLSGDRAEAPPMPITPSGQQLIAFDYTLTGTQAPRCFSQPVLSRPCSPSGRILGEEKLSAELAEAMRDEIFVNVPAKVNRSPKHKLANDVSKRRLASPPDDRRGRKLRRSIQPEERSALARGPHRGARNCSGEAGAEVLKCRTLADSQELFVVGECGGQSSDEAGDDDWHLVEDDEYADMPGNIHNGQVSSLSTSRALASIAGLWGSGRSPKAVPQTLSSKKSRCMPPRAAVGARGSRSVLDATFGDGATGTKGIPSKPGKNPRYRDATWGLWRTKPVTGPSSSESSLSEELDEDICAADVQKLGSRMMGCSLDSSRERIEVKWSNSVAVT